jgi:hypothetical protein
MNNTAKFLLSTITATEIAECKFLPDAHGETFDRILGCVAKADGSYCRVKVMKTGVVRQSYANKDMTYCDPKISTGRAKAVLALVRNVGFAI